MAQAGGRSSSTDGTDAPAFQFQLRQVQALWAAAGSCCTAALNCLQPHAPRQGRWGNHRSARISGLWALGLTKGRRPSCRWCEGPFPDAAADEADALQPWAQQPDGVPGTCAPAPVASVPRSSVDAASLTSRLTIVPERPRSISAAVRSCNLPPQSPQLLRLSGPVPPTNLSGIFLRISPRLWFRKA